MDFTFVGYDTDDTAYVDHVTADGLRAAVHAHHDAWPEHRHIAAIFRGKHEDLWSQYDEQVALDRKDVATNAQT